MFPACMVQFLGATGSAHPDYPAPPSRTTWTTVAMQENTFPACKVQF